MILKMEKTTFVKKAESRILRSEKTPVFYVLTLIYERHLEKPISIGLICSGYERWKAQSIPNLFYFHLWDCTRRKMFAVNKYHAQEEISKIHIKISSNLYRNLCLCICYMLFLFLFTFFSVRPLYILYKNWRLITLVHQHVDAVYFRSEGNIQFKFPYCLSLILNSRKTCTVETLFITK